VRSGPRAELAGRGGIIVASARGQLRTGSSPQHRLPGATWFRRGLWSSAGHAKVQNLVNPLQSQT